jgi:hypothetical protein
MAMLRPPRVASSPVITTCNDQQKNTEGTNKSVKLTLQAALMQRSLVRGKTQTMSAQGAQENDKATLTAAPPR